MTARLAEIEVDLSGQVEPELHACQVELISDVCADAGAAIATLRSLRRAVLRTGAGLLGSGTHPAAPEGAAEITDKDRYERIRFLLGDAAVTPVAGLHVHVGMPDAATAIAAFNGLREHLPLLQALAANSPFRHGRDTGLASAREVTLRAWPRSGVPRALRDYEDFVALSEMLARAGGVPDYTWFWWKLRPHPRLGTVEVRALDVQASLDDTAALVALVHCLVRAVIERPVPSTSAPELIEEGLFRAARFGGDAELPDATGALRPAAVAFRDARELVEPFVDELGCRAELERVGQLLSDGGARQQRRAHEIAGMDALLRDLTALTGEV